MDTIASSAYAWALHEMGYADFNDERLNKRVVKIAATLLQHPQNSIPQACKNWSETKAVYRFFANDKINSSNMIFSHIIERYKVLIKTRPLYIFLIAQSVGILLLPTKRRYQ